MTEPIDRSHETNTTTPDFQKQIEAITDRTLTPENINIYADEALEDLIEIVNKATSSYDRQPTVKLDSGADHERTALSYYGLDPSYVEATLDHIADTAEDISRIKAISETLMQGGVDVITPPDALKAQIITGDGSFERKKTIPRLQTVLLTLEKNFGINVDPETSDPHEFQLIPGRVTSDMVRQTPYNVLDIPALNRVVDVCDEEGNRTFVFNREKLLQQGIAAQELKDMTKDEMKELIQHDKAVGHDVIYSHLFVENIVSLLNDIPEPEHDVEIDIEASKLLKPEIEIPDDYASRSQIAERLGVEVQAVHNAVGKLKEELSPIRGRTLRNMADYYSPEDQDKIEHYIHTKGVLVPKARPDQRSVFGMAKDFHVTRDAVNNALTALSGEIGTIEVAKFGSVITEAYSELQQGLVKSWLNSNHRKMSNDSHDKNIEVGLDLTGYKNQLNLAKNLGTTTYWIAKIHADSKAELDEVIKVNGHWQYSPQQQNIIEQRFVEYTQNRPDYLPDLPERYETRMMMAIRLGIHHRTIDRAIKATADELGDVLFAKVSNNKSRAYSPDQQKIIERWLSENMKRQRNSKLGAALLAQPALES